MDIYGYVYLIRNKVDGKVYVGQTTKSLRAYILETFRQAELGYKRKPMLYRAIRKHGRDSFDVVMLHQAFSKSELDDMEIRAIWSHDSRNRELGYNVREGGSRGKMADESKLKLSASLKSHYMDPVNRAKASTRGIGHVRSLESRRKQSQATTGVKRGPMSSSHLEAMTIAQNRPEVREKRVASVTLSYINNPELRKARSESSLRRWQTPEAIAGREARHKAKQDEKERKQRERETPEAIATLKARRQEWSTGVPKKTKLGISGYRGVTFRKEGYEVYVRLARKKHYVGRYATADEAASKYNEKAIELYGAKAILNEIPNKLAA